MLWGTNWQRADDSEASRLRSFWLPISGSNDDANSRAAMWRKSRLQQSADRVSMIVPR